ncbi:hypothetical protein BRADI_2g19505v3 [Brachypodium distachyon]|uniref:Uncharacterized protein n=1 Tax=Brachypodium distachyon TaxID=15368 RepID=A0A2K2D9F3_BRADI|nr:hypothetical protein BRADI_2g19505v3 [Brachypodium distachyon]
MRKTMVVGNLIRKLPLGHYNTKFLLCNVLQPRGHACSQKFQHNCIIMLKRQLNRIL